MNIDYLLIDASGSMIDKAQAVIRAANSYAQSLTREFVRSQLTVATFTDLWGMEFKELASGNAAHWKPITDFKCDGGTPLNDAIWRSCERIKDQTGLFEGPTSICLAIISDGGENASQRDTESTRDLIAQKRAAGWQIIFLGLDFDSEQIARDYGCEVASALNTSARQLPDVMKAIASKRAKGPSTPLLFDHSDKRRFG